MANTEDMVPKSVAARMLTTGFEWEAGLFTEVYKELAERFSNEEARDILGKAMYRAGYRLSVEARQFSRRKAPREWLKRGMNILEWVPRKRIRLPKTGLSFMSLAAVLLIS